METVVVQGNGIEASHGSTTKNTFMEDGGWSAITVEGAEACQGELTIEDISVNNGIIDADGAQPHGAERVSDAQGAQVAGHNASMVSRGITGAGS